MAALGEAALPLAILLEATYRPTALLEGGDAEGCSFLGSASREALLEAGRDGRWAVALSKAEHEVQEGCPVKS